MLARQSAAPQWWRWERGEPSPSIPANNRLKLSQNGFPLEPEKKMRAKVCDSRRRVALQKSNFPQRCPSSAPPVHGPLPLVDTPPTAAEPPFNKCLRHNGRSLVPYKRDMFPTHNSATSKDGRFTEGASGQSQTPDATFRITL